jgi:hypothetical protein
MTVVAFGIRFTVNNLGNAMHETERAKECDSTFRTYHSLYKRTNVQTSIRSTCLKVVTPRTRYDKTETAGTTVRIEYGITVTANN